MRAKLLISFIGLVAVFIYMTIVVLSVFNIIFGLLLGKEVSQEMVIIVFMVIMMEIATYCKKALEEMKK